MLAFSRRVINGVKNMIEIIFKAMGYIGIIILAFILKRTGVIKKEDSGVLTKMLLWITLPCSVISAFSLGENIEGLFFLPIIGFALNIFMIAIAYLISIRKTKEDRALYAINISGYNIGAFAMPFVQGFLGPSALTAVCMFDAGNAIMCTGGVYALAKRSLSEKSSAVDFFKNLFASVPFDAYLFMFIITLLGLRIPQPIVNLFTVAGSANGFVAMFLIGVLLEFKPKRSFLKRTAAILCIRYSAAILLSVCAYFLIPLPLEQRQGIVLVLFAPITAIAPVFTQKCGAASDIASFAGSCSFIISIICMTTLVILFGL